MANNNYDNIILGSGIAGLTVFYYLAFTTDTRNLVITNNLASQATSKFPLGPRFLHSNKDTDALLKRLKLSTKTREIFIGYKAGDDIRNYPDEEFKKAYAMKSRGTEKIEASFLSGGGKSNFTAFEVSQAELANLIFDKTTNLAKKSKDNKIIVDNLKSVDFKKVTTEKSEYYGDNIVSTIPLPALLKLVSNFSISFKIQSVPEEVNFILTSDSGKDQFDYIYSVTDNWHRKTYAPELDKWVYEVKPESLGKFENEFKNRILDKIAFKSQITNSLNLKELGRIKLVGRYAQLNHSIKTEDVVKWAYQYTHKFDKRKK